MVSLDAFLPSCDARELHSISIDASPERVIAAARELRGRDVPLFALLMALRSIPALFRARRLSYARPIVAEFERAGFVTLAERPDELVLGGVGRFWQASGGLRRIGASEFAGFEEPGWAKTAVNFHARAGEDGGTRLTTETRVLATDPASRRRFRRYWRVVRPGSGAIRIAWLRAIRRSAERG
jgi:hypothetical protein